MTDFSDFMREVEAEAEKEGPEAVEELRRLREEFAMARRFTDTPTGYRDLYWCWHLNEPVIIEFHNRGGDGEPKSYCRNCHSDLLGDVDGHSFVAHILKPGQEAK